MRNIVFDYIFYENRCQKYTEHRHTKIPEVHRIVGKTYDEILYQVYERLHKESRYTRQYPYYQTQYDDESIFIDLPMLVEEYENIKKVRFFINIYEAVVKQQNFSQVKNAFVRVVNLEDESEFLRYDLEKTEDKTAYSVEVGEISYDGSEWTFTAIGKYGHDSTGKLIENSKTIPQGKFAKEKKIRHMGETQEENNETENKKTFLEKLFDFFC